MHARADIERLCVTLNGQAVTVDGSRLQVTLLDFIRSRGLTGAKEGCAEGECGACAVALVVPDGQGSAYRAVNSCLVMLAQAVHREVYTVEALADAGGATAVQRALAEAGASQCGYCTPGFVMSLFVEQHRRDRTGPCDPEALGGNLCRCTGYRPIRDAALVLGPAPDGPFVARLARPASPLHPVAVEGYGRPATVDECVRVLAEHPDSTLIAGGTDLVVEANLRGRRWPRLVSTESIAELNEFSDTPERIRIGAGLPLADLGRVWRDAPKAVSDWLTLFGSPLIRNRATIGGNLVTASPVGDGPPLLLALDAVVNVAGPSGRRAVPLAEFFTGYRTTRLQHGELVTSVDLPKPLPQLLRFYKVAKRRADDISTVAAGMALDLGRSGVVHRARFAFGGVAATPLLVAEAAGAIVGQVWNRGAVGRVHAVLDRTIRPVTDHRGSKAYRLEAAKSLVERFLWEHRA
jgi:xanthine dehydrogenase small subunit